MNKIIFSHEHLEKLFGNNAWRGWLWCPTGLENGKQVVKIKVATILLVLRDLWWSLLVI